MGLMLHALDGCPDCEAVMEVLEENEVEYDVNWVESRFSTRDAVKRVSGQRSVPVLEDEDRSVVLVNATNIERYVELSYT